MNYNLGKIYHGFKLHREEKVEEINSIARVHANFLQKSPL